MVPVAIGIALIGMSLMTDYELSVARLVPFPAHLAVDGLGGALLAASPRLFGFADRTYLPHLVAEIGLSLVTFTTPTSDRPVTPRCHRALLPRGRAAMQDDCRAR